MIHAPRQQAGSQGSASVELTLLTPAMLLVVMLAVTAGRLTQARLDVTDATHQAARAASIQRQPETANTQAREVVAASLRGHRLTCHPYRVAVNTHGLRPGSAVIATTRCTVHLRDLVGLHLPGTTTITANAASVTDRYRGVA